jgi:hypothetical protein
VLFWIILSITFNLKSLDDLKRMSSLNTTINMSEAKLPIFSFPMEQFDVEGVLNKLNTKEKIELLSGTEGFFVVTINH